MSKPLTHGKLSGFLQQTKKGVSKNRGKTTKMDGLFHGRLYFSMDDLGGKTPPIFGLTPRKLTIFQGILDAEIPIPNLSVPVSRCITAILLRSRNSCEPRGENLLFRGHVYSIVETMNVIM